MAKEYIHVRLDTALVEWIDSICNETKVKKISRSWMINHLLGRMYEQCCEDDVKYEDLYSMKG